MWKIGDHTIKSRLLLGTSRYPSPASLRAAIVASGCEIVTLSLRRESATGQHGQRFWGHLKDLSIRVLPNTAGCYSAHEAVTTAHMARDLFSTNWIKLEVIGDDYTLQPDPFGLIEAAQQLSRDGFEVFPYTTDDLIVAQRLIDVGCRVIMPWASPIGSGLGLINVRGLSTLRARFPNIPIIVDAGLGRPSHAAAALELGCDAVLLNTAVAMADDPEQMATAFARAVEGGRLGYESGLMRPREFAVPSTPVIGRAFTGPNPNSDIMIDLSKDLRS
jgi:thiazole synthase